MIIKRILSWVLALSLVVGLAACASREEKSLSRFQEARQVEETRGEKEAEALYRQILADYPGMPGARKARERLDRIRRSREETLLRASLPVMKRIRQLVEGYQAKYRKPPKSAEDFDDGEFFFDSDYMAETVPEDFTVYLALQETSGGCRIWSFPEGAQIGFTIDGGNGGVRMVPRAEALKEIGEAYDEEARKGRLVFLIPRA